MTTVFAAALAALSLAVAPQPAAQSAQPAQLAGQALLDALFAKVEDAVRTEHQIDPAEEVAGGHQLAQGATGDLDFEVSGGTYMIVGVCDESCGDLNIRLTTAQGEPVGEDVLADDTPVVTFQAEPGAGFRATLDMVACGAATCLSQAKVYKLD